MSFAFNYTWGYYPITLYEPLTASNSISNRITVIVYPIWYKQITLEWVVPSSFGLCTFNVYKSEIEDGEFVKINHTPIEEPIFKDTTTRQFSKSDQGFYIVEAVLPDTRRVQSLPSTWENARTHWVELRAIEVQRREWILLTKFVGVKSFVLRRKTYGQRCRECWDFYLEKLLKDKCETCLGTSYEGGYFKALETYLQYDPNPKQYIYQYFGGWEPTNLSAWTISFPDINPRDLLYRIADGAMFLIEEVSGTALQASTVRQIFKLNQLDTESPEYLAVKKFKLLPDIVTSGP